MGHIVQGSKGVGDQMHGKADSAKAGSSQAAEGKCSGPHQVGPAIVVGGVSKAALAGHHSVFDQSLHQSVLDGGVGVLGGQVEFEHMTERIGRSVSGQVGRYGEGRFRIENGDLGVEQAVAKAEFFPGCVIGDHHPRVHLRTGCSQGENTNHGQGLFDAFFTGEEFPHIMVDQGTGGNGLGRIDDRTAACGNDHLCPVFPGQGNPPAYIREQRVGANATKFGHVEIR